LRELLPGEPITLVVGIARDKDARAMLAALVPLAARVILTAFDNPRAADPTALRVALPVTSAPVEVARSAAEALALARTPAHTATICVAGSLFLVGDVLAVLRGRDNPCPIEKGAASMDCLF
jgi:dihydrofolate synthase/folylpolyglutamate synthase